MSRGLLWDLIVVIYIVALILASRWLWVIRVLTKHEKLPAPPLTDGEGVNDNGASLR
jgi:hypothetical protein